jgi:hypothetical protein
MDCDMLALTDICELWSAIDTQMQANPWWKTRAPEPTKAVLVCQHDYVPKSAMKMDGQIQTTYPRKNWSSLMVFDNHRCNALTPEYVNEASGLDLHRFNWLAPERLGSLPLEWNHLVGEYEPNPAAKLLHYTLGGPWMEGFQTCEQSALWWEEYNHMRGVVRA